MKYGLIFSLFLLFSAAVFAQSEQRCGNDSPEISAKNARREPVILRSPYDNRFTEDEPLIIPVIVHIIHSGEDVGVGTNISAAQVLSQFEVLNEDFSQENANFSETTEQFRSVAGKMNIRFVPARIGPDGERLAEAGIDRAFRAQTEWTMAEIDSKLKPDTYWDPSRYFNMWTVDNITGLLGYATFPNETDLGGLFKTMTGSEAVDGLVVDYDHFGSYDKVQVEQLAVGSYNLGRTATHEMGHALGLLHTFRKGFGANCEINDYCADTPGTIREASGCDLSQESCSQVSMVQNFMDYATDGCMSLFTQDQVARMLHVLEVSPRRRELLTSEVTGIEDEKFRRSVQIFPNPSAGFFRIRLERFDGPVTYKITDTAGREMESGILDGPDRTVGTEALAGGLYFLKLSGRTGSFTEKIVVEK